MDQEHLPCARFIKWHLDIRHIERSSISGPVDPVGRSRNSIFFSCQKVFVSPSPTPGFVLDSSDQTSGKSHTHSRVLNFHTRSECENPTGPNYNHQYRALASNWVGLTPRRAYEQKTTQIHDGFTAIPSVPFPHRKHKGNKLSVQLSCLARATCIVWSSPVSAVPCC